MKLWIDDVRPAPEGYKWIKSVNKAKNIIEKSIVYYHDFLGKDDKKVCLNYPMYFEIEEISLDHDAGNYYPLGGDYIQILNWLEEMKYTKGLEIKGIFTFHSMNPVGVTNMRKICERNGWRYE